MSKYVHAISRFYIPTLNIHVIQKADTRSVTNHISRYAYVEKLTNLNRLAFTFHLPLLIYPG